MSSLCPPKFSVDAVLTWPWIEGRDPDSRPPTNLFQKTMHAFHGWYQWAKTPEATVCVLVPVTRPPLNYIDNLQVHFQIRVHLNRPLASWRLQGVCE